MVYQPIPLRSQVPGNTTAPLEKGTRQLYCSITLPILISMVDRLWTNGAKMSSAQGFVVIRCHWIFSEIHYSGFQLSPKASQSFWSWSTVLNGRPGCKIKLLNVQHKVFYRVRIETNNCRRSMSLNKTTLTEGLNGVTVSRKTATKFCL